MDRCPRQSVRYHRSRPRSSRLEHGMCHVHLDCHYERSGKLFWHFLLEGNLYENSLLTWHYDSNLYEICACLYTYEYLSRQISSHTYLHTYIHRARTAQRNSKLLGTLRKPMRTSTGIILASSPRPHRHYQAQLGRAGQATLIPKAGRHGRNRVKLASYV